MSFLIILSLCFLIHMFSRMRYFKSINLFVGVILVQISPKAFPKECCYLWCLSMIQVFSYPLGESNFHLFVNLKQAIVSVSGRLSPHNFEMFSISPLQAYSFGCWFSNNPVVTFLEGCFPRSFVAEVGIFFFILLFQ